MFLFVYDLPLLITIGLVIFMILALDCPFRVGLGPEPYQLIYDQLMKQ
jgi:hypothetical protein